MPFAVQRVMTLLMTLLWPSRFCPRRDQALQRSLARAILPSPSPPKVSQRSYSGHPVDVMALMCAHPVCIVGQLQVDQFCTGPAQERDGLAVLFQGLLGTTFATTLYKACMASQSCYLSEAKAVSYM